VQYLRANISKCTCNALVYFTSVVYNVDIYYASIYYVYLHRLLVRTHELVVFDAETHDEMENFPIELVNRPAAFFSRKPDDIYRNIVLLTVLEDPLVEMSESEVHVFQSYEHSVGAS